MLHISKWERQENASRDKLGTAALNLCKVAKSTDGVHSAKFYWPNPNMVAWVSISLIAADQAFEI